MAVINIEKMAQNVAEKAMQELRGNGVFIGRWIPVSERLPDNTDPVNITWINHDPESYYADIKDKPFTATGHYCNGRWWWYSVTCQDYLDEYGHWDIDAMDEAIEVIAWMPLPKPYEPQESKKGENNDRSNQETKFGAGCGGNQGI